MATKKVAVKAVKKVAVVIPFRESSAVGKLWAALQGGKLVPTITIRNICRKKDHTLRLSRIQRHLRESKSVKALQVNEKGAQLVARKAIAKKA